MRRRLATGGAALACLTLLGGCAAVIDQSSFFPRSADAPNALLVAPPGYTSTDAMIELPGLGTMHAVRLDNPASETTIVYSGGNGEFVVGGTVRSAALAAATGADIILYDYPGRGGTTVPATMDAAIATGPALVAILRQRGWIGRGPLFAYGLSFGGSQAAAMVRDGGFAGLMIEGSAADIASVGRNFVPALARPFVKLRVDPALARFDYLGYATAPKTPVLLISSQSDSVVKDRNMRAFADQLRARDVAVTFASVPGGHGTALREPATLAAVRSFVAERSAR